MVMPETIVASVIITEQGYTSIMECPSDHLDRCHVQAAARLK